MQANIDIRQDNFWQHPYVDVFKYYNIGVDWKRTDKKGDVHEYLVSDRLVFIAHYFAYRQRK